MTDKKMDSVFCLIFLPFIFLSLAIERVRNAD
jgi:hypothetical protein